MDKTMATYTTRNRRKAPKRMQCKTSYPRQQTQTPNPTTEKYPPTRTHFPPQRHKHGHIFFRTWNGPTTKRPLIQPTQQTQELDPIPSPQNWNGHFTPPLLRTRSVQETDSRTHQHLTKQQTLTHTQHTLRIQGYKVHKNKTQRPRSHDHTSR